MSNSSEQNNNDNMGHFVVEKKISIAFVFTLIAQTFLGGWWAATASAELRSLKEKIELSVHERYTKTEARLEIDGINRRIDRIEMAQIGGLNKLRDMEILFIQHEDKQSMIK